MARSAFRDNPLLALGDPGAEAPGVRTARASWRSSTLRGTKGRAWTAWGGRGDTHPGAPCWGLGPAAGGSAGPATGSAAAAAAGTGVSGGSGVRMAFTTSTVAATALASGRTGVHGGS